MKNYIVSRSAYSTNGGREYLVEGTKMPYTWSKCRKAKAVTMSRQKATRMAYEYMGESEKI